MTSQRPDPIAVLRQQEAHRLARQPHSGVMVQRRGDAHLMNFGFYASPEHTLVFGVNDCDETLPDPYEWALKRLLGSVKLGVRPVADFGAPGAGMHRH